MGNLISDFVKGKKQYDYPADIQQGIRLHRAIDAFTDTHAATREAKKIFQPTYRLYSGAFVDVVYDHFLANDQNEFAGTGLFDFSQSVYAMLDLQQAWFPQRFALLFPHMKMQNWLFNYRTITMTAKSFEGLVRRSAYMTESETALHLLEKNYSHLQDCYNLFWKDIKPYARGLFGERKG